jgi:alginate O-acetyltransferase complex protein AlgI
LFFVVLAWVWFRAPSFAAGCDVFHKLFFTQGGNALDGAQKLALMVFAALIATHWLLRERDLKNLTVRLPAPALGFALGLLLAAIVLSPGDNHAFIYFQF